MAALAAVIRNTSRTHCKSLFESLNVTYPPHWANDNTTTKTVVQEARQLKPGDLEKLRAVSERIKKMSEDDLGQEILMSVVSDKISLKALTKPFDRAVWVFRNDPDAFKRAEHYYFHDASKKFPRLWDNFELPSPDLLKMDTCQLQGPFLEQLKEHFGNTDDLLIEVYERPNEEVKTGLDTVKHIVIYREGLPGIINEIDQQLLKSRIIKPVRESALSWNSVTRQIGVVSRTIVDRKAIAKLFSSLVLGYHEEPEPIPVLQYYLDGLRSRPVFGSEPKDGIKSVIVKKLTLIPIELEDAQFLLL